MTPDQAVALAFDEPVTPTSLCHDPEIRGIARRETESRVTSFDVDTALAVGNIIVASALGMFSPERES